MNALKLIKLIMNANSSKFLFLRKMFILHSKYIFVKIIIYLPEKKLKSIKLNCIVFIYFYKTNQISYDFIYLFFIKLIYIRLNFRKIHGSKQSVGDPTKTIVHLTLISYQC